MLDKNEQETRRRERAYHAALPVTIERLVRALNAVSDVTFTFGYLGNTYGLEGTPAFRDDRSWFVFAAHPGRVGKADDRIGGVSTADLDQLVPLIIGAISMARIVKRAACNPF